MTVSIHSLPKVLLIFCGGTISMHKNDVTGALDVAHGADQFFRLEPRIVDIARLDVLQLLNIDSTNVEPADWEKLVAAIEEHYDDYDGFVVTIGTNTMAWAASALSFALQNLGKPVVFTGAQIPAEAISTDARNNLVNSLRLSTMNLSGVFVAFGSKIILGCRSKKLSESELDAFGTFNDGDFGQISVGIQINKPNRGRHSERPVIRNGFEPKIVCLTLIPGLVKDHISTLIQNGIRGIIIRSYGSGDIPYSHLPSLEDAREKEVPVIVTTQCRGSTIMGLNDPGLKALKCNVIQAFDMSMEAMSTKLMWLMAQGIPYSQLKSEFHRNIAGEINTHRPRFFINKELEQLPDYQEIVRHGDGER